VGSLGLSSGAAGEGPFASKRCAASTHLTDVFIQSTLIGGTNDDGDLPSLVEGARAGQPAAVERLVARVQDRVRGWAARFTEDADAADDVAQEVLIGLERRVRTFSGTSRFSTWLFSVTRNVALSRRRREQRRAFLLGQRTESDPLVDETVDADPDAVELARLALRYFDALPGKQRMIFESVDLLGMTPAELARELGMEQVTVRAHLFKARRTIRSKMLEHHERMLKEYRS
jgi:RNA polymerase sigma-70 factor (ECF subfamily)